MDEYEDLDDITLLRRLETAAIAERLKATDEWKLVQEARKRIVERAVNEFAIKTKADNTVRIIELQTVIRKYKYGLFKEIELLADEGRFLYEAVKRRDLEAME